MSADARPAPVVLGSWPTPLEPAPRLAAGNLVLDLLAGARLVWTGPATAEQVRREVERQAEQVRQDGGIPHVIPFGGSNSYAAQAYVDCSGELLAQLPGLDHVIVAFGSGLIARVAGGNIKREDRTVFMHTGGLPGLFGHSDLPRLTATS